MIDFGCPRCGTLQRVPDGAAGKKVSCAKCGQRLKVPDTPEMRTMQAVLPPPKPPQTAAGKQWYYQDGNKQCGPVTWAQLRRMADDGDLSPEDRVWGEGMATWKEARLIANLFPKQAEGPPPAPAREGSGKWLEGAGVFIFGGLGGLALLLFVAFLVWRGVKKDAASAEQVAEATQKEAPKDRALEPKEVFERCSTAVARVQNNRSTGSGFLARPGVVVTNSHVVAPDLAGNLQVTFPSAPGGNKPLRATLIYEDRTRDLAILRIDSPLQPLLLAERECPVGEKVVVIGSPGGLPGQVVENAVTSGELSARAQLDDNQDWYQISAAINPGNSGGPVFDSRGQVIGVVTQFLRGKQAMNYAVPHADVRKALERAGERKQQEVDQLAAEHDAVVAFRSVGKASCLYLYAMTIYYSSMKTAVEKGGEPDDGLKVARERVSPGITGGAGRFLDADLRAALPRVVGNKSLPDGTRQQMEELVALHSEMKGWFERPRGTLGDYGKKRDECNDKVKRLFESLRLKLGVNEDPRLTEDELDKLNLPH